jgi:magnesium chelatase subunit I
MGTHQMSERQVLDAVIAMAVKKVFDEYVSQHGIAEITSVFSKGVKVEVGDLVPSAEYEKLLRRVPEVWDKAFEVNASTDVATRASCVEFVLAGMYANDMISRAQSHGRVSYEI